MVCALGDRRVQGPEVDTRTETTAAVGACSDTALNLQTAHAARHVCEIDPEDALTLRVIQGHLVHRHVDTRLVCSANMEIRVTHSYTIVARHYNRRTGTQQVR